MGKLCIKAVLFMSVYLTVLLTLLFFFKIRFLYIYIASNIFYMQWGTHAVFNNKSYLVPFISFIVPLPFLGFLIFIMLKRTTIVTNFHHYPTLKPEAFIYDKNNEEDEIFRRLHLISGKTVRKNETEIEVLRNGDAFFPRLFSLVEQAESYIFMEFAIFKTDKTGRRLLELLNEKGKAGVEVKIIFDGIITKKKFRDQKFIESLKFIKINIFTKLKNNYLRTGTNFRFHRKICVIDSKFGLVCGFNVANEYLYPSKRFNYCRDSGVLVKGLIINELLEVFKKDWYYLSKEILNPSVEIVEVNGLNNCIFLESGPDGNKKKIKHSYLEMISFARREIRIATPYLVPDDSLIRALFIAAERGCRIKILVPGKADKILVNQVTKAYYSTLLKAGIEIFEYNEVFVHSKLLIIDNLVVSVGSANFDMRSMDTNFESTLVFCGPKVQEFYRDFEHDLLLSDKIDLSEYNKSSFFIKQLRSFLRAFSSFC